VNIPGVPDHFRLEDLYVECRVLCAFLMNMNDERAEMLDLEVDDFHDWHNGLAFQAMRNLEARSVPVEIVNVIDWIDAQGKSGSFDLALVMSRVLMAPDYPTLAMLRRDVSLLRKLQQRRANEVALDEKYTKKGRRS
jgi:replicative DNA helicase